MAATHSACRGLSQGAQLGAETLSRGQTELSSSRAFLKTPPLCSSFHGRKLPVSKGCGESFSALGLEGTRCIEGLSSGVGALHLGRGRQRRQSCRAVSVAEPPSAETGEPEDRLRASEAEDAANGEPPPAGQDGASYFSGRTYFPLAAVVGQVSRLSGSIAMHIAFLPTLDNGVSFAKKKACAFLPPIIAQGNVNPEQAVSTLEGFSTI